MIHCVERKVRGTSARCRLQCTTSAARRQHRQQSGRRRIAKRRSAPIAAAVIGLSEDPEISPASLSECRETETMSGRPRTPRDQAIHRTHQRRFEQLVVIRIAIPELRAGD